jgi:hypothetical protein
MWLRLLSFSNDEEVSLEPMIDCQIDISHLQSQPLTVGQLFFVLCKGDFQKLEAKQASLVVPDHSLYRLQLLDLQILAADQVQLTVTSYKTGDHRLEGLALRSLDSEWKLPELNFQVASVIEGQQPPPEVFGPRPAE